MPAWISSILTGALVKWGARLFKFIYSLVMKVIYFYKLQKANDDQGAKVQAIADKIKKLHAEGKEIPEELKDELRRESSKLISS